MSCQVWLVRHGHREDFANPQWVENARYPHDPPLSAEGFKQAAELAQALRKETIDLIVCSPFQRTVQTGYPLATILDLPILLEWGICEGMSEFTQTPQLLSEEERQQFFPRITNNWASLLQPVFPETRIEALQRSALAAQKIVAHFEQKNLLLIGHGISIAGAVKGLSGFETQVTTPLCGLFQWTVDDSGHGQWTLFEHTGHLSEPNLDTRWIYSA